jgi:hypothetical protein
MGWRAAGVRTGSIRHTRRKWRNRRGRCATRELPQINGLRAAAAHAGPSLHAVRTMHARQTLLAAGLTRFGYWRRVG